MSKNFYKQVALSQLIISGWILYAFFDYLIDNNEMGFGRFGLLIYFLESCMWVSGIGLVLSTLRFTWFRKYRKPILIKTFIYVFAGIFNGYLVVIWILSAVLGLMRFEYLSLGYTLAALLPACVILRDFYRPKPKKVMDTVVDLVD